MADGRISIGAAGDERVRRVPLVQRLVLQPALGSAAGFVLLAIFFAVAAAGSGMFRLEGIVNWLEVSGELGLIAIAAALLMIAGEFDLSIGSMIGFSGMVVAIPSVYWGVPVWGSILIAGGLAVMLGLLNGYLVIRTRLPSFIVTLAFLYILRGLTLALSILFTGRTVVSGVNNLDRGDPLAALFGGHVLAPLFRLLARAGLVARYSDGAPVVAGIPSVVVWWLVLTVIFHLVLTRTRLGNHIFASGGDANAARNLGVPVARVKMLLFANTALCAAIYGINQVIEFGSASADRGLDQEFEAIIAAVIGGSLLTGGYGSVIGACFGALIFGVTEQGIYFANWPSDWFRVFLGTMLLIAVLFNSFIRRRAMGGRE